MRLLRNINGLIKSAMAVALIGMLGFMTGCDDSDDGVTPVITTEVEKVFTLLSTSGWNVSEVTIDGNDFTSTYPGLSLNFDEGVYTSVNGGAIFAPSGTWTFTSTVADQMLIDNDLEVDIIEISETSLVLGLVWGQTTIGTGGRSESVGGAHVFTFTK